LWLNGEIYFSSDKAAECAEYVEVGRQRWLRRYVPLVLYSLAWILIVKRICAGPWDNKLKKTRGES